MLIGAGDPYLEPSDVVGRPDEFFIHLRLFAVAETAENGVITQALDNMITTIVLNFADWNFEEVSEPFMTNFNNAPFLACRISVARPFELTTEGN